MQTKNTLLISSSMEITRCERKKGRVSRVGRNKSYPIGIVVTGTKYVQYKFKQVHYLCPQNGHTHSLHLKAKTVLMMRNNIRDIFRQHECFYLVCRILPRVVYIALYIFYMTHPHYTARRLTVTLKCIT